MDSRNGAHPGVRLVFVVVLSIVVGCTNAPSAQNCEAEADGGAFNCIESDASFLNTPPTEPEGSTPIAGSACSDLLASTCGSVEAGVSCQDSSACVAATLLSTYEPQNCGDALGDDVRFPACETNSCGELVIRVCGALDDAVAACLDAPECAVAKRLQGRATGGEGVAPDPNGLSACSAALEDPVIFPACASEQ